MIIETIEAITAILYKTSVS